MKRFVEEADRGQWTLLPECLDDFVDESNPVRVIDVFVDTLDLAEMSFEGVEAAATGRPSYHPSVPGTEKTQERLAASLASSAKMNESAMGGQFICIFTTTEEATLSLPPT